MEMVWYGILGFNVPLDTARRWANTKKLDNCITMTAMKSACMHQVVDDHTA